jgi:hypothetical protein
MKTPTIASPARMSESTYNKFTVHLRYLATNNLANRMIPCEFAHNPAPEVTARRNIADALVLPKSAHDSTAHALRGCNEESLD